MKNFVVFWGYEKTRWFALDIYWPLLELLPLPSILRLYFLFIFAENIKVNKTNMSSYQVWSNQAKTWKWVIFKTLLCQPTWFKIHVSYTIWKYTWSAMILAKISFQNQKFIFCLFVNKSWHYAEALVTLATLQKMFEDNKQCLTLNSESLGSIHPILHQVYF